MEGKEGFRRELIKKFDSGNCAFDEPLLNALLTNAYHGRDLSALASALLTRFPSVRCALGASYEELMTVEGMTSSVALYLKACDVALRRMHVEIDRIESPEQFINFATRRVGEFAYENLEVYVVDESGNVLKNFSATTNTVKRVDMDIRDFFRQLNVGNAYGFYMLHNHFTLSASPSAEDDKTTFRLLGICRGRGIKLIDHCIVSYAGDWYSYKLKGRLE